MKKISVALLLISIALLFTGCMGGGGSSSITATGLTATTQNLSLNADFSNETTALNLRASSIDTNSFKFRVKALNNGEPAGSWQEVTANYGTNGLFNAQLSVENNYTEFLTEFLYPDGSIMLANLQNVVSASGTAITTNVYTTANRVAFAKWKNTKNPTVKTYSSFLQNLNANDMMAIDSVARLFSDNLKEYFSYVSGESSNTVITFLNEWSTSTSFSTNANNALSQLDAIVARIGTDITTAPPTNGPTVPPGSTTNSGEFVPTISYWEAISGADSTLSAAGRVPSYIFSANDTNTSYDAGFSTAIALNHDLTQITGSGATYSNGIVTISAAGTYVLSGELNGHIFISGKIPEGVNLVLNGVTINGQTHAAIYSEKKSTPVSILLVSGTNNVLSDASSYTYYEDDEPGACLFAKGDLLIKGSGSLTVNGYADENGIQSKGEGNGLVITGGSITVETRSNGIKAKKIAISGGNFKVTTTNGGECFEATESNIYIAGGIFKLDSSGGDAIKAENDWEEDTSLSPEGNVYICGGTFSISAFGDGVQATRELVVSGGSFNITTTNSNFEAQDESSKGMKSGTDSQDGIIVINGGDFTFNTTDHAIKCKGSIEVFEYPAIRTTSSLGKGISATGNLTIGKSGDPKIHVYNGEEGLESKAILSIQGGNIHICTAFDDSDGINAGGDASDGKTHLINISGGYIYVESNGDGVDTNSDMEMSGGTLISNANPLGIANAALDTDQGSFRFTGGTIIGAGPSQMAHAPDSSMSSVPSLNIFFAEFVAKGQLIHIQDSGKNEILTFLPAQDSNSLVFCSNALRMGETYSIYTGGSHTGVSKDGVYSAGVYTSGTIFSTVTQTETTTIVGTPTAMTGPGGMPPTGTPPTGTPPTGATPPTGLPPI